MKRLALDTATEACSVALEIDGQRLSRFVVSGREHSRHLPAMLHELLAEAGLSLTQLDGLICGIGPGSFAGVRIGVAYAKGLAAGLELPVAGVSSLAMLAQGAIRKHGADRVLAAIDARMSQVYFGVYAGQGGHATALVGDAVCDSPDVEAGAMPASGRVVAVGTGWGRYRKQLDQALQPLCYEVADDAALPDALDALDLVRMLDRNDPALQSAALLPQYLRHRVALTRAEQAAARNEKV